MSAVWKSRQQARRALARKRTTGRESAILKVQSVCPFAYCTKFKAVVGDVRIYKIINLGDVIAVGKSAHEAWNNALTATFQHALEGDQPT
jgi:hypothetical protein